MIIDAEQIFAFLVALLGVIYFSSQQKYFTKLFDFVPPVVWAFFLPLVFSNLGVIPRSSVAYDVLADYALPVGLFLLTLSVDLPALMKIGRPALAMMGVSIGSILLGTIISFALFRHFLPADAWQGMTALSASWIGGSANMIAWQQGLNASPSVLGPVVVVDTIVGYGWLAIVIAMSSFQARIDKWTGANTDMLKAVGGRMASIDTDRRPLEVGDLAIMLGLAFGLTLLFRRLAVALPSWGEPSILSPAIWVVMLASAAGIFCSNTRIGRLEKVGASKVGYVALLLLMTSIGAKADVRAIFDAPLYMIAGLVVMSIHVGLMVFFMRVFRVPVALCAIASIASIGGAISAPVAASAYNKSLASLGVLLGLAGYIVGIYAPFISATVLNYLAHAR